MRRTYIGKGNPNYKHGLTHHALHRIWRGIKARCYNPNANSYEDYGGRGIRMCSSWKNDFVCFYRWAISRGWRPGFLIDRKNVNRGYAPWNCQFVTIEGSNNNSRQNVRITAFGETKTLSQWSRDPRCVVCMDTLRKRIRAGWKPEKALTKPARLRRIRNAEGRLL